MASTESQTLNDEESFGSFIISCFQDDSKDGLQRSELDCVSIFENPPLTLSPKQHRPRRSPRLNLDTPENPPVIPETSSKTESRQRKKRKIENEAIENASTVISLESPKKTYPPTFHLDNPDFQFFEEIKAKNPFEIEMETRFRGRANANLGMFCNIETFPGTEYSGIVSFENGTITMVSSAFQNIVSVELGYGLLRILFVHDRSSFKELGKHFRRIFPNENWMIEAPYLEDNDNAYLYRFTRPNEFLFLQLDNLLGLLQRETTIGKQIKGEFGVTRVVDGLKFPFPRINRVELSHPELKE